MARIRTIKPEFWTSERIGASLPGPDGRQARLLFIALWNQAEDRTGVLRGNAALLRGAAFPYDEDVTNADVERWLSMLESARFIVRYERNGSRYIWVRGFVEHQRIDRPSASSLPEPSEQERDPMRDPCAVVQISETRARRGLDEGSLQEGNGGEGSVVDTASQSGESPKAPAGQQQLVDVEPTPKAEPAKKPPTAVAQWVQSRAEVRKAMVPPDAPQESKLLQRQWAVLGEALRKYGEQTLSAAWLRFAADGYAKSVGVPMGLFSSQVDRWVSEAQAEAARMRLGGGDKPRLGPPPTPVAAGDKPRL